nr:retrotransposable element Tf2 [Tanacetum cinerariifolium]
KANVRGLSRKSGMIAGIKVDEEIIYDLERMRTTKFGLSSRTSTNRLSFALMMTTYYDREVKIEHQRASGLLQPLDIPVWKWDEISMDFVTGLPRTQRRHDAIWVVVDRLTKSARFLLIRKDYPVSKLAKIFQQEIVRLHGTPSAIVSDRDLCFTSRFWKGLQKAWGTSLKVDRKLGRLYRLVEFAYNNSWHASIKCAPFEMLYGRKCRALICWDRVGERVIEGPEMIEEMPCSDLLGSSWRTCYRRTRED